MNVGERPRLRSRLDPLDLALVLADQDPHPHDLLDLVVVTAHLAAVALELLLLLRVRLESSERIVPPVSVLRHDAQQVALALSADHARRGPARPWLPGRARHPVVPAPLLGPRGRAHRPAELH